MQQIAQMHLVSLVSLFYTQLVAHRKELLNFAYPKSFDTFAYHSEIFFLSRH